MSDESETPQSESGDDEDDLEPIEDVRERLREYEEKYADHDGNLRAVGGDIKVTNDSEEIAEAQRDGTFDTPGNRPRDDEEQEGASSGDEDNPEDN